MKTEQVTIDGVSLTIPYGCDFPPVALDEFPHCCGPGTGITELAIPERLFGLKVSAACYFHDQSWETCFDSRPEFEQTNRMFLDNLLSIINTRTPVYSWKLPARYTAAWWYYRGVSGQVGWLAFVTRKIKSVMVAA